MTNIIIDREEANAFFKDDGAYDTVINDSFLDDSAQYNLKEGLRYVALSQSLRSITPLKPVKMAQMCINSHKNKKIALSIKKAEAELILIRIEWSQFRLMDLKQFLPGENWECADSVYQVNQFLSKCFDSKAYLNTKDMKSVVFVTYNCLNKERIEWWSSLLVSCLFRLLPWRFPDGLSENDITFFSNMCQDECENYRKAAEAANKLCKQAGIKLRHSYTEADIDSFVPKKYVKLTTRIVKDDIKTETVCYGILYSLNYFVKVGSLSDKLYSTIDFSKQYGLMLIEAGFLACTITEIYSFDAKDVYDIEAVSFDAVAFAPDKKIKIIKG